MSAEAWDTIEKGAEPFWARDASLSKEQAIDRFLQTDEGRAAYAQYGEQQGAALLDARAHASFESAGVAKGRDTIWAAIEFLAGHAVRKSDHALSKEQAIDRILKTAEGRQLYALYLNGAAEQDHDAATRSTVRKAAPTRVSPPGFAGGVIVEKVFAGGRDVIAKADAALDATWQCIEAEVLKEGDVDYEDAVDDVFDRRPDLAEQYARDYAAREALTRYLGAAS